MKKIIKIIILFLIQLIEKYEYANLELNQNDVSKKILKTINLQNLEIQSNTGFKPLTNIHITQPYTIWYIKTENNLTLECADNHIVFNSLNNQIFVKDLKINDVIQTKYGPQKVITIKTYKQKNSMYDVTVKSNEHTYYSNGILCHNTTTISAFFAWYICFHSDRNASILANKQNTAIEIVSKVMYIFRGLPFFLKPGVINSGALGMRLDNGCQLFSQATTKTAQIGYTIHILYLDEFAHIPQNIARSFWRSVYPTLSSSDISQCIITSTPNGMDNLFFEIWDKAQRGENTFWTKRVDYWEVPGHDDEWVKKTRSNFGEEEFAQEFELKFDITQNLLLSGSQLALMKKLSHRSTYSFIELEKTQLDSELYQNLKWINWFDPNDSFDENNHRFVITVDLGEGKEEEEKKDNDFNIASIHNIKLKSLVQMRKLRKDQHQIKNLFRMDQVGLYRDNIRDAEILGKVCKSLVFDQLGEEICKLCIEMNYDGKIFVKEFKDHDNFYDNLLMRSYHTKVLPGEKPPRKKIGYKTTSDKSYFCKLGKKIIGEKTIILTNKETYSEYATFGKNKKGQWKGIAKHDDTVMATLNLSRLYSEDEYSDWLYDFLELLPDSKEKRYALEILKEPYDNNDMSDDMFSALYDDNDNVNNINQLFSIGENEQARYKPGLNF